MSEIRNHESDKNAEKPEKKVEGSSNKLEKPSEKENGEKLEDKAKPEYRQRGSDKQEAKEKNSNNERLKDPEGNKSDKESKESEKPRVNEKSKEDEKSKATEKLKADEKPKTDEKVRVKESNAEAVSAPNLSEALHDPDLFENNTPGKYQYESGPNGKHAYGNLQIAENSERNPVAQRSVGGDARRETDDGGHLIGARFGGASGEENLDAQDRNLNRGGYKRQENGWTDALNDGDKIYANIETYKGEGNERPDAYMGYTIIEHPDGTRDWDAFSFQNESKTTQEEWAKELESVLDDDIPNAMLDDNYDKIQRIAHEEE